MSTLRAAAETDLTRFYAIFPQPAMARDLFNIVEGHRVDSAIRRAYPGIRRDMAKIQSASAERRPDLATLSDAQAVVEALLQHTLSLTPDLTDVAPATRQLIGEAVAMLDQVAGEDATVGDRVLVDDGNIALVVEAIEGPDVVCTVVEGGPVSNNKGMSLPGMNVSAPALSDKDVEAINTEEVMLAPERIRQVVGYVLDHFDTKTMRGHGYNLGEKRVRGFNSMFATASISALKSYYLEFEKQQAERKAADPSYQPFKIATIFSYNANEEIEEGGILGDEALDLLPEWWRTSPCLSTDEGSDQ